MDERVTLSREFGKAVFALHNQEKNMSIEIAELTKELERIQAVQTPGKWTHTRYSNEHGWWSALVVERSDVAPIDSVITLATTQTPNQEKGGDVIETCARLRNLLPAIIEALKANRT